ncbi:MAG TPA: hypothetical protein VK430_00260 [Xanthobacteraceae bacterium]|nr:hypothetical protein [Xanthobacteraceae bacterium]
MAKKSQIQKFWEAAREVGADESEERFNATLKGLAKAKREAKATRCGLGQHDPGEMAKPKH